MHLKKFNFTICSPPPQSFPGDLRHRYVLPGAAWDSPAQTAAAVDGVPFTHPAHIPALLELLRHQCVINTLLRSCISSNRTAAGTSTLTWPETQPHSRKPYLFM